MCGTERKYLKIATSIDQEIEDGDGQDKLTFGVCATRAERQRR